MKVNKVNTLKILGWVGAYLIIGCAVFALSKIFLPEYLYNVVNVISILGVYSSVFALVVTLYQVMSIKQISEQTKEKINNVLSVSDCTKYATLVRTVQDDIRCSRYELALYKLQQVKDYLLRFKSNYPKIDDDTYKEMFKKLGYHITTLSTNGIGDQSMPLNTSKLIKDLEALSAFMTTITGEVINKI